MTDKEFVELIDKHISVNLDLCEYSHQKAKQITKSPSRQMELQGHVTGIISKSGAIEALLFLRGVVTGEEPQRPRQSATPLPGAARYKALHDARVFAYDAISVEKQPPVGDSSPFTIRLRILEIAERVVAEAFKEQSAAGAPDKPRLRNPLFGAEAIVAEAEKMNRFVSGKPPKWPHGRVFLGAAESAIKEWIAEALSDFSEGADDARRKAAPIASVVFRNFQNTGALQESVEVNFGKGYASRTITFPESMRRWCAGATDEWEMPAD